jgi:hypothetical protein
MSIQNQNLGVPANLPAALARFLDDYDARLLELNRLFPIGCAGRYKIMQDFRRNSLSALKTIPGFNLLEPD